MRNSHLAWSKMTSRLQQEGFRARVTRILQAWADWAVYPTEFLLRLNDVFLGQDKVSNASQLFLDWSILNCSHYAKTNIQLQKSYSFDNIKRNKKEHQNKTKHLR